MKGLFALISATLAFVLNTCITIGPMSEPSLPSCTWRPSEVLFRDIELSIPSCVNLGIPQDTVFYDLPTVFWIVNYNLCYGAYGEFIWSSSNTMCNDETNTRTTIFNTAANDMNFLGRSIRIDSLLTTENSWNVSGNACVKIDNVLNFDTGEIISLIWESGEYDQGNFLFVDFIAEARIANVYNVGRIYIHNEFQ